MFEDRLRAVSEMVLYVNDILLANPIVEQFSLEGMNVADPIPNIKLGEYDQSVTTEIELEYIDTDELDPGYRVLVLTDISQDGLWVLYTYYQNKNPGRSFVSKVTRPIYIGNTQIGMELNPMAPNTAPLTNLILA
jgi:hypothetical protein